MTDKKSPARRRCFLLKEVAVFLQRAFRLQRKSCSSSSCRLRFYFSWGCYRLSVIRRQLVNVPKDLFIIRREHYASAIHYHSCNFECFVNLVFFKSFGRASP